VHSCHVTPPSVVLAPLVIIHGLGSVPLVVPATMQAKTRSLPTVGVADCLRNTPAATAVDVGHAVTAVQRALEQYQTVFWFAMCSREGQDSIARGNREGDVIGDDLRSHLANEAIACACGVNAGREGIRSHRGDS
jgi:hypothetical protein